MDFHLEERRRELQQKVRALAQQHAAPVESGFNAALLAALEGAGMLALAEEGGALDAVLATEQLSQANALVPYAAQALLAPLFPGVAVQGGVAVCLQGREVPVRYAREARWLVSVGEHEARLHRLDGSACVAKANYVYPLGYPGAVEGRPAATCPADAALRRWRLGMAAEAVGAMDGAMSLLLPHLCTRVQFGQKLGSFQALQHRMAEHAVALESSRWLVRDAAWHDDAELAAVAASFTTATAYRLTFDAHQLYGARGFLLETGLYRWTLRMKFLSLEAGGQCAHADAAALLRWPEGAAAGAQGA